MLVSQAEFARQMNVSRKTVTRWKSDGMISMSAGKVDVEASRTLLLQHLSGRSKSYLAATELGNKGREGNTPATPHGGPYPDLPGGVINLAVTAECSPDDVAVELLPLLPEATVRAIHARLLSQWRAAAVELLDQDYAPPAGMKSWGEHPLFSEPIAPDWDELRREAGIGKSY